MAELCAARKTQLIIVHSYGFMGYIRLALNEHTVVETHPDHAFPDIRVLAPPAALVAFARERYYDLSKLSTAEYAHVPCARGSKRAREGLGPPSRAAHWAFRRVQVRDPAAQGG